MLYNDLTLGNRVGQDKLPSAQVAALIRSVSMVSVSWTDCVWFHPMHYSWQTLMLGWFRWALGTGSDYLKWIFFLIQYTFWSGEPLGADKTWRKQKRHSQEQDKNDRKTTLGASFYSHPRGSLQCERSPHCCGKSRLQVGGKCLQPESFPYTGGKLWLKQMSKLQRCIQKELLILCILLQVVVSIFCTKACCADVRQRIKSMPVFRHVLKKKKQKTETLNIPPCLGNIACPSSDDRKTSKWRTV